MKKLLIFSLFILGVFSLNAQSYSDSISQLRKEHLAELMDTNSHILNQVEITEFVGLDYYEVSESLKLNAIFTIDKGKKFKMQTSSERTPVYRRYGYVDFTINNQKQRLTVYQNIALSKVKGMEDYLFIPFKDSTSAITTYDGGRYLDFKITSATSVLIDFNLAYNPYCAYSHHFSCPIPPAENTLLIGIEAGEKYVTKEY